MDNLDFLGTGWEFPPAFDQRGIRMVDAFDDIRQSLHILFSTSKGERIFRADYGCNIRNWIFSSINLSEKTLIIDTVKEAIRHGEPRITVEAIDIEIKNILEGELWIHLRYLINATNRMDNLVFPIYLTGDE